ncbi:MAG: hypothetical protein J6R92_06885 [Akkermansia sp.]|nr:hypothetical protein [Akkermansia sp.]
MKHIPLALALAVLLTGNSCRQISQRVVGPIPPPAPETLTRPLSAEEVQYYTLPLPVRN